MVFIRYDCLVRNKYYIYIYISIYIYSFPIYLFTDEKGTKAGSTLRLLRLIRLYRILKIFKILRSLKLVKNNASFEKFLMAMKIYSGLQRLIKAIIIFAIFMHFFACAWFYEARLADFDPDTWVVRYGIRDLENSQQYLISLCW